MLLTQAARSVPGTGPETPDRDPRPLRVTRQGTVLVRRQDQDDRLIEQRLSRFAEPGPADERVSLFRLTESSLWQAFDLGVVSGADDVLDFLRRQAKGPLPQDLVTLVDDALARKTALRLVPDAVGGIWLTRTRSDFDLRSLAHREPIREFLQTAAGIDRVPVRAGKTTELRLALLSLGYPVRDVTPLGKEDGPLLSLSGRLSLRPYQREAAEAACGHPGGGVVALPCGGGKTWVGLATMARTPGPCLVVVPHRAALEQWHRLLLQNTTLQDRDLVVYAGQGRGHATPVAPRPFPVGTCVLVTYSMLAASRKDGTRPHLAGLGQTHWGLIIFDEVHVLPATVFRLSASLTAQRRLGLSATLVREDGHQGDVVALVGPVVYARSGTDLEEDGYLAAATLRAVRVPLDPAFRESYPRARTSQRLRMAATNPAKDAVCAAILERHRLQDDNVLILGQYLDQLARLGRILGCPVVTGRTPTEERQALFDAYRAGRLRVLILSRVANMAIDLPSASCAIQVSGSFGSRQEEAQRLGRLLRPKPDGRRATFYSLVTERTPEERFASHRSHYLKTLGYDTTATSVSDLMQSEPLPVRSFDLPKEEG